MQTKNTHLLFSFVCVCLIVRFTNVLSADSEALALGCGSEGGKDADGRKWESDAKYLASQAQTVSATSTYQDPSLPSPIPYMSARVFTSESTYKFDVKSKKRYLIRLHFYPSTYDNLDQTNSYFSVIASGVTLLNNFSASITAQALTQSYIVKEYSLAPLEDDKLEITFKPSDKYNGAFAFVNGIEVIPMPDLFDLDHGTMTRHIYSVHQPESLPKLLRLHFCDYQLEKVNQMVFDVLVNNQTAEEAVDVIGLAGSSNVPVYKDYAVFVKDGPGDDEQLFLALHPSTSPMLLKAEASPPKAFTSPKSSLSSAQVIGGVTGGAAAFGVVAALCIAVYQRKRRVLGGGTESHTSSWLPLYGNSHTSASKSTISGKSTNSSRMASKDGGLCRHFTLPEIRLATKNFDESYVIGVGGFGKVYKGVIDGTTKVAIKRSNPSSEQGVHEFETEIELLSKLRHRHLVTLIGFCEEDGEMALVYDYMSNGTLREHIYKNNKTTLSWKQRLEVCIGAARGLHYLHTGAKYTIIHRDVKTTNILVDENWVAKVSDFGLSKTGPEMNQAHVSTVVKGSFGYLDPEYYRRQQLTEKSDVYSFGVVLFEVLCARAALNPSLPKEQVSLADWAIRCIKKGTFDDIIDPTLKKKIKPECLKKYVDTAEKCLGDHGTDRPSMGDVLWNLEFALQLQENVEGARQVLSESSDPEEYRNKILHVHNLSLGGESEDQSPDIDVFSQIHNPKGQ